MRVWLLHPAEPVPYPADQRLFRYGTLCRMLALRGHEATQWASTFDHFQKTQRSDGALSFDVERGYRVELVPGRSYRRHVSWARIQSQRDVAAGFSRRAPEVQSPDLIIVSLPTLELATAALDYAEQRQIPVVVDVRDLWPDVFLTAVPGWARSIARPLLRGLDQQARAICRRATCLTAVSEEYLQWGLEKAGRLRNGSEGHFYLAYEKQRVSADRESEIGAKLAAAGVGEQRTLRCCFCGTLGRSAGIKPLIALVGKLVQRGNADIEFVVCGRGPREAELLRGIGRFSQVRHLGWLNAEELAVVMSRSDIGLALYEEGVLQSIPNKPVEYLAGGLSVLTTLRGELGDTLNQHGCGGVFAPVDIDGMASWLIERRQERDRLAQERQAATQLYRTQFDATVVYGRFIDWLQTISQYGPLMRAA